MATVPVQLNWQNREQHLLASYATFSVPPATSRRYPEPPHAYRGPFQRDRDRVLHSAAFRRLSGKMQVFTGDMGDYHRTRLTHTNEVASIARTIARQLRLNEDLVEALALLHDVGHPPYGHCGEDALQECLRQHGGFSHNDFALRLVESIERRHTATPGLNLSAAVLAGQQHRTVKHLALEVPSLEVQVVDAADSIAYDAHDVDDALQVGLLQLADLRRLPFVARALEEQGRRRSGADPSRQFLVHAMIETQVHHFLEHVEPLLESCEGMTAQAVREQRVELRMPSAVEREREELEAYLFANVYRHPRLVAVRDRAAQRLSQLFHLLQAYPERLPDRFAEMAALEGVPRAVGTYLAGMTDRFCDETHTHLVEMGRPRAADW